MSTSAATMKYRGIAATLRMQILRGELPPGSRLPTRRVLEKSFSTMPPTIQKAVDLLVARGFVEVKGRRGTFVVERLPSQRHYALAFSWSRWRDVSQFYRGLADQAATMSNAQRRISCFHGLGGHLDVEDSQQLHRLVRNQQVHGVIFCNSPFELGQSQLLTEPGLPRVAIESRPIPEGMSCVYPDLPAFWRQAVARLHADGRRRIAHLLLASSHWDNTRQGLLGLSDEFGLSLPNAWIQCAHVDVSNSARHLVEMWMREAPASRPDAIVVHDDNLLLHATRGLIAAGVQVPEDVAVVAHANFPYPTPTATPVIRLGFDLRKLLDTCIERLDEQYRGDMSPPQTLLPVVREDHVPSSTCPQQKERLAR